MTARGMAVLMVAATAGAAQAQEIAWSTIDGGGGTSSFGTLAVTGTIGQPDAGTLSGGDIVLRGGFWPTAGLTATHAGDTEVATGAPLAFRLASCAPNPFRAGTAIRFELPRETRARVKVYDVAGRLVRTLVDADLPAGRHESAWDGRDTAGRRTASGVYLLRMQAGTFGAVRKLVRLE